MQGLTSTGSKVQMRYCVQVLAPLLPRRLFHKGQLLLLTVFQLCPRLVLSLEIPAVFLDLNFSICTSSPLTPRMGDLDDLTEGKTPPTSVNPWGWGGGGVGRRQAMPNQHFHQAGRAAPGGRELVRFLIERDANEM